MPGTESAITRRGLVKASAAVVAGAALPLPFVRSSRGQTQDPAVVGAWSPVYAWPKVAIHLSLLPNGKLLTWSDDDVLARIIHRAGIRAGEALWNQEVSWTV